MLISGMLRTDALSIFSAAVEAVKPARFMPRLLQCDENKLLIGNQTVYLEDDRRVVVVAAGKAAAAMALETEKILGSRIKSGLVVTKYAHALPLQYCTTLEAAHPVPDENSVRAGKAVVGLLQSTAPDDIVLLLISGGASALLADYPPGSSLDDLRELFTLLLHSGAAIDEMNTVRKHLSLIKGGQLVRYTPSAVFTLILSDVPGDDLSVIASGLTVPDNSSFEDTRVILERYHLMDKLPDTIRQWIEKGLNSEIPDTPGEGDPAFKKVHNILAATNAMALEAAAAQARQLGYTTAILSPSLEGDAEERSRFFVSKLRESASNTCLLWGGETTVVVKGAGKGGRNQQFALAAADIMHKVSLEGMVVLSGGTDGTDGPTDAAGAIADDEVILGLQAHKLDIASFLENNDAFHFFEQTDGLIITGPTQTNVMDIVVGLKN